MLMTYILRLHVELPPPAKKRRGLAGSIVSTAVNAALIGTAVGLTFYRLWRDRGKEQPKTTLSPVSAKIESSHTQQQHLPPPPPPYQEREWTPISYPSPSPEAIPASLPVPTPRRKVHKHSIKRPRKTRVQRTLPLTSPARAAGSSTTHVPQPEFDFRGSGEGVDGGEDEMDWIGDRLAKLIEEGKRALNREVVVMSDAKEDEVDDGNDAWEEERDDRGHGISRSRSNSVRRGAKRSRNHEYGSPKQSSYHLPISQSLPTQSMSPRKVHVRGFSSESVTDLVREDENSWQSPELRETMQKARERILEGRRVL